MNFCDAHNHLHDAWLAPHRAQVLADLARHGVTAAVVNGTAESDWAEVAEICAAPGPVRLLPSFGVHPWDAGNRSRDWQQRLVAQLDAHPSAGVGEIGLDRWMLDRARPDDPRLVGLRRAPLEEQLSVFRWQFALAAERNLPCTIHCLDAFGLLHDTVRASPRPARGFLLHAYSGSLELARSFAALGAYFSFNGYFLDPRRARRLAPVFAAVPPDRLLVETDAPAMRLPVLHEQFPPLHAPDGSLANHPANLAVTYVGLATLLDRPLDLLIAQTELNFRTFFRL